MQVETINEILRPVDKEFEAFWKQYNDLLVFTKTPDKGKKAENFLYEKINPEFHDTISKDLKILRFVKDTALDKFYSRIHGQFKSLVGRVLKQYKPDVHICEAFKIPVSWLVECHMDFHLGTPQALSFYTMDQQGRHFVIDEIWENLSAAECADEIIRRKKTKPWNIKRVFIDPLSKGDWKYGKNEHKKTDKDSTFRIMKDKLAKHNIVLDVGSKDKVSGVKNLESWLEGPNKMPILFYFDTLNQSPKYGHMYEIMRWVYGDDGKPKKEFDHFMECDYRHTLTGFKWVEKKPPRPYRPMVVCDETGY